MNVDVICLDDKKKWDEFVLTHSPQALFQSWEWGEVQKALGHKTDRIGYYQNGMLVAVAQAVEVHAKRGSFLHVRHGPIFDASTRSNARNIIEDLRQRARNQKLLFVRASPLLDDVETNQALFQSLGARPSPIHAMDGEYCWVLDLDKPLDQILKGMRKTTRYEIRSAQKLGIMVRKSEDVTDLKHFHELYAQTAQRHGFVQHAGIDGEFAVFSKEHKALVFNGWHGGKVVSSAMVLFYGGQAIYHHSASIPTKAPVSTAIQWEAITEAKKRGMKQYNFWGIAPPDHPHHPWQGITMFKKGFGGREVRYLHAWDIPVSPLYVFPFFVEAFRKWRKGY